MSEQQFERAVPLPVSAETAFRWHEQPGALDRLIPPWEQVRVARATGGIGDGAQVELVAQIGPVPVRWLAEHSDYQPGVSFRDTQLSGPFAKWVHTHRFVPRGEHACELVDHIDYRVPGGGLGAWLGGNSIRAKLDHMFTYRHATTAADLALHARYAENKAMHISITGGTGMVGTSLTALLTTGGHRVTKFVRKNPGQGESLWDPAAGQIDSDVLASSDAVIHLAGDNIAEGRWNKAKKARILQSRVQGTRLLAETLAKLATPPKVLVSASAIGFYGSRGDEWLDEQSSSGAGFLADVCRQWEAATEPAKAANIRVVNVRFGVILSPRGGALAKMLLPFKLGGGGIIGSGQQYWSWVTLDDVIGAVHHTVMNESLT
ncbi:MAG TPA: TIGR01777 family oxidoreductase, partial [Pirellulaceae bacterium]|nr:TIGR01777 family oxidoreductase [Pirellulaceae bacterium]